MITYMTRIPAPRAASAAAASLGRYPASPRKRSTMLCCTSMMSNAVDANLAHSSQDSKGSKDRDLTARRLSRRLGRLARALRGVRREVQRRVPVEEPERLEPERHGVDRHHRPVLGPGDVVDAEHVPQHHVGVLDPPVRGGPSWKPRVAQRKVRELPARPPLVLTVG